MNHFSKRSLHFFAFSTKFYLGVIEAARYLKPARLCLPAAARDEMLLGLKTSAERWGWLLWCDLCVLGTHRAIITLLLCKPGLCFSNYILLSGWAPVSSRRLGGIIHNISSSLTETKWTHLSGSQQLFFKMTSSIKTIWIHLHQWILCILHLVSTVLTQIFFSQYISLTVILI